jgi:hypothetical protein
MVTRLWFTGFLKIGSVVTDKQIEEDCNATKSKSEAQLRYVGGVNEIRGYGGIPGLPFVTSDSEQLSCIHFRWCDPTQLMFSPDLAPY